jgi:hypothetical protein
MLTNLMGYIVSLATNHSIPPEKVMICNFVKFMGSPNVMEMSAEKNIPEVIQKCLDLTEYSNCFYEWFGYRFYLYNFIYNYKKYGEYIFMYRELIRELENSIKKRYSDPFMVTVIQDEKILRFWDNVFDLSSPTDEAHGLAISLKNYLTEHGQLKYLCI